MLDTPLILMELSVMEHRYQAVSFVIHDGESVLEVARRFNVSRQTVHARLARYERGPFAGFPRFVGGESIARAAMIVM